MIYRILLMVFLPFVCSAVLGCPITHLMGDRTIYGLEGEIRERGSGETIPSVKVKVSCVRSKLDGQSEASSDENGRFKLRGYGAPADCTLTFEHPGFLPKTLNLDPALRERPKTGLSWVWSVSVELEPRKGNRVRP